MKFKLDENLGSSIQHIFREKGFDTSTVFGEKLGSCSDEVLFEICSKEKRCLLTYDKDFTDIKRFPPKKSNGIVVFRFPQNLSLNIITKIINQFISEAVKNPIKKNLWIVEIGRIRIKEAED